MNFKRIDAAAARELIVTNTNVEPAKRIQIADIRDDQSFAAGHIENAVHLHNANLQEFIANGEFGAPLLVYCYHGHMSMSAAAYLAEQGFADTYSLDGGYEAWEAG
ncbi:MAG: thiosulfate sulfurtransferase GlpE [Gammaproteobacteria bacterium]|nr:thiosulfate sulfurtransferase GlpE [Gammaproteobacteria bacterium]MDD9896068.1 thiosulfate sulfurtransferase GlpE [Gammaproteobacteria bacterium]MDD9958605.1 thiosulfate sulfurtransferase GlpE [Gammaproteobacteria bacterium]